MSAFYWLKWLAKGSPEVIVTLPENVDFCEIEAESNQVLVADIKADKIYAEAHNVKVVVSCMVDTLNGTSVLEGEITKVACLEVVCENGMAEVCDKHKADLGRKTNGCAHYAVHCLNGKAVVK